MLHIDPSGGLFSLPQERHRVQWTSNLTYNIPNEIQLGWCLFWVGQTGTRSVHGLLSWEDLVALKKTGVVLWNLYTMSSCHGTLPSSELT